LKNEHCISQRTHIAKPLQASTQRKAWQRECFAKRKEIFIKCPTAHMNIENENNNKARKHNKG